MKFSVVLAGVTPLAAAQPIVEQKSKPGGQSTLLPFFAEGALSGICFPGELEQCIGTKKYCETKGWTKEDEPKQYTSAEACFADHQPQPRDLLPFVAATKYPVVCFPGELEQCIGTKKYCETKGWTKEDEPEQYASAKACYADRQPQPGSASNGPTNANTPTTIKVSNSVDNRPGHSQPQLGNFDKGDGLSATAAAGTASTSPPAAILRADIRGDTNRDGVVDIEGSSDVEGKDKWSETSGAIFLANIGDSGDRCKRKFGYGAKWTPIKTLAACHDASDDEQHAPQYMAPLRTVPMSDLGDSATATVMVSDDEVRPLVRIFCQRGDGWEIVKDDTIFSARELRRGLTLGIDAREPRLPGGWDGRATVDFIVKDGDVTAKDTVMLRVAPVLLHHHRQAVKKVFAASLPDATHPLKAYMEDLIQGIETSMKKANIRGPIIKMPTMDIWTQDYFEPSYTSMPGPNGTTTSLRVMIQGREGRGNEILLLYNHLRGDGIGAFDSLSKRERATIRNIHNTYEAGGNIETIPPYEFNGKKFPAGRVVLGGDENNMPNVREFFGAQELQDPLIFDTTWLFVKHFDEIMQFVPTKTERGWAAMVVDPQLALAVLRDAQRNGSGNQPMTSVKTNHNFPTIDEFLADKSNIQNLELASKHMSANIELLKKETGITDGEIFRLPALFVDVEKKAAHHSARPKKQKNSKKLNNSKKPKTSQTSENPRIPLKRRGEEQANSELDAAFTALIDPHMPLNDSQFGPTAASVRRQAYSKQPIELDSYLPSLVNGLPLSDSVYVAPKPYGPKVNGNDIFEVAATQAFRKAGFITVDFISEWRIHKLSGDLHCITNTFRDDSQSWW